MEVSARKAPLILPRERPGLQLKIVEGTGARLSRRVHFEEIPHLTLPPGRLRGFFPGVEDKKSGYGCLRLHHTAAVVLVRYYKEATDRGAFF